MVEFMTCEKYFYVIEVNCCIGVVGEDHLTMIQELILAFGLALEHQKLILQDREI